MRVLFLSSVFPVPDNPSHGIYCLNLLQALVANHEIRAVVPRPWFRAFRRPGVDDTWLQRIAVEVTYPTFYYPPSLARGSHGWCMWRSARASVLKLLGGFRPDCILSYWVYPDGEAALRTAISLGVPVALIVGGSDVLLNSDRSKRERRLFEDVLRSVDEVFAVSQDIRAKVIEMGVKPDRVFVSHQGVDSSLFSPGDKGEARRRLGLPEAGPILLWVGRMVPVKALDVLLESCVELRVKFAGVRLYLVGLGPLKKSLEARVVALGLEEVVRFAGGQPQASLPDWYRASDLVVLPSHSEGIPNVLREAKACGRPFVASRVGGIPEVADPDMSELVEPGSVRELTEAVARMLNKPPIDSARRQITWEDSAHFLAERLGELLDRRRPEVLSRLGVESDAPRGEVENGPRRTGEME